MLTKLLYKARGSMPDLWRLLGSWRLSIVLIVAAGLYQLLLAIWSASSPPHVVQNVAGLLPFWIVWVLMLVNTVLCLWPRLPRIRKEAGTFLFHGSFLLIAAGFLLSIAMKQESTVRVGVGEEQTGAHEQLIRQSSPRLLGGAATIPKFKVEKIVPEFWRDQLLFTTLASDLILADGTLTTTRINRPIWLGWATFLRLSGFGYAPRYELRDFHGQVLDSAFVKLNVFPPGARDSFSPEGWPHRIYVEVYPDFEPGAGGAPSTKSLNLTKPAVAVRVLRGKVDLGSALLQEGESFEYEGMKLRFPEIQTWGDYAVVWDPGAPLLFLGYLMGLAGLAWKIRKACREEAKP